jgi:hypothetical protein
MGRQTSIQFLDIFAMPFVSVSCELNPVRVRYRFSDKAGGFDLEIAGLPEREALVSPYLSRY